MIKKVLVANRGEIAVRVIRACRELSVETVAVYSEADRLAPHVWMADEAYLIGPARAAESYLSIVRLLNAAQRSGCDAVHPGYGFLAENADFAAACEEVGLIFIGPTADTIALMGDKTAARKAMERAGVPVVPGSKQPLADAGAAREASRVIGYPVLLKAAAGGGGKGMRRVEAEADLESAWEAAQREAQASFSDPRIYVEKLLENPRHIEFQILADEQGNIIHLNERECSIQRRHQKLIEESPSPAMTPELRERMGEQAVAAALEANYCGAGTVEFMVVGDRFYFLEMNTRLQVEHPVTEMVTGLDLVHAQLRIASGQPLETETIAPVGHSIECRINA
jgi:acetyl-CoA carboxylase biotin carboxylase subunit